MSAVVAITHASFEPTRRKSLYRLLRQLKAENLDYFVQEDATRKGSLATWKAAMAAGLATRADHVVWLPDDAILCKGFGPALTASIESQPTVVFDCYANHRLAPMVKGGWYTTPDGYVGLGGVMPRALLVEHIVWRETYLCRPATNDGGVNLWAMATGRSIWKTAQSLVDHDDELPSLDGNSGDAWRRPATFAQDAAAIDWTAPPEDLGRTYERNHWGLITKISPPMVRRAYELEQRLPRVAV